VFIPVKDAAAFLTEEFFTALEVYCISENIGCLPFAGGWAEQPEWITLAISTLKVERFNVDKEEGEKERQEKEDTKKHGKR
jgi:hypothetical protein